MFFPVIICENVMVQEKQTFPGFVLSLWNLMDCSNYNEGALIGLLITLMADMNTQVAWLAAAT